MTRPSSRKMILWHSLRNCMLWVTNSTVLFLSIPWWKVKCWPWQTNLDTFPEDMLADFSVHCRQGVIQQIDV